MLEELDWIIGRLISILFVILFGAEDKVRTTTCPLRPSLVALFHSLEVVSNTRFPETPGEDAFRVSRYAEAFVRGLEGPSNSTFKRGIATCKHFAAYDLEDYKNVTRWVFDAKVSTQDLAEYYTPPFQACARDARAGSIMCSYNNINGVPSCLNPYILQTILREHWNWEAPDHYITSDGFALDVAFDSHNYTTTPEQTAADALKAGVDTDDGVFFLQFLPAALSQGLVQEADLDRALTRIFSALIKLGYYDPPASQPYRQLNFSDVNTPTTQSLARYAVTSGMTLLKNENNTLPLSTNNKTLSIALVGDWSNATTQMLGDYAGIPPYIHSPLYGLQRIPNVTVNQVIGILDPAPVLAAASAADITIYIGGLDNSVEGEGLDRTSLTWNTTQVSLITRLYTLGKPLIIAQTGAGQLDDTEFLLNPNVSAILWIGYPGQDGGTALADILFGNAAPAGRLPVSMYPASYIDVPATDMSLRPNEAGGNPGRTYKWYNDSVLEFGYGLHYTSFSANASITWPAKMDAGDVVRKANDSGVYADLYEVGKLVVDVRNEGDRGSDYSVLAFVSGDYGPLPRPRRELMGYGRARDIGCGETRRVELGVRLGGLTRWDERGRRVLWPGKYKVVVDLEPGLAEVEFEIVGEEAVVEWFPAA